MPKGIEQRVEELEKQVNILNSEMDKVTAKLKTIDWDADHIGAEAHPYDRTGP